MNGLVARIVTFARSKFALNLATAAGIAVIMALLAMFAVDEISFFTSADRFVQDWEIATRSPIEPQDKNIVIVAVDEGTMQNFAYRSPLDRGFLAKLLTAIDSKHPKAIGLDYLFDQPTEPAKDAELRRVLRTVKTPLAVSYFEPGGKASADQVAYLNKFVPASMRAIATVGTDQTDTARWIVPGGKVSTGEKLMSVPRKLAAIAGVKTADEQVPIVWRVDPGENQPAFAQISACVVGFAGCLPLSLYPPAVFKDKIVLIGSDLTLVDHHRTPFATDPDSAKATLPGVVILATATAQLLEDRDPPQLSWWNNFLIALVFAALGAALGLAEFALPLRAGAVALLIAALWGVGVFVLFASIGILIGLIAPTIAIAGSFAAVDSLSGLDARRQRAFVQGMFSRYVSPKVVQQLVEDPTKVVLGGERREMTLLFTDIANFTTMSEGLDSRDVGRVLNAYLDGMTTTVHRHDGTVDKFIGDSVFAIFNAPIDIGDHATKGVQCMIDLDRFTESFRTKMNHDGIPLGITRIGVHTGIAAVGDFGSHERSSYTATGDVVNAASRLEGLNKTFGTRLCVSEATRVLCKGVTFRPIASVVLKGKTEAMNVFEPIHDDAYSPPYLARFQTAFDAVRDERPEALGQFEALAAERPDDSLVAFYIERLRDGHVGIEVKMTEK
jgi:adenylate cyclase